MSAARRHPAEGTASIVVVNWNGREWIEACLMSALAQEHDAAFDVVLVDNGSSDGSVAFVRERFPEVRILENSQNNYAGANNLGAASSGSEFIVCLNTDTRLPTSWLQELLAPLREDPSIGGVTPLVLFEDGRVNSTGIETLPGFHWRDRDFGRASAEGLEAGEVEGISGCSAAWRRSCWEQVGGLDEDFHMYYEDVDMSLRARRDGWRLWFTPSSIVHHAYNASIRKLQKIGSRGAGDALKDRLGERNRLFVIARHYPRLLIEALATSRFLLHEKESEVRSGIELLFAKWEEDEATELARRELVSLALRLRTVVLEREAWARGSEVELKVRDQSVRSMRRHLDQAAAAQEAERRSWRARVQRLEDQLRDGLGIRSRAESEALDLRGRMVEQASAYETQGRRDREALRNACSAYEREIAHREGVIAELKRLLAERDAELERQRARSS
ncbi:MAG: glycosyltransferase family 2 protein [Planctomycetes bacterium]|nr:glycosyltransferase family 2 protein [Planctomycetota bacterium]